MKIIRQDGHSKLVQYTDAGKVYRVTLPIEENDVSLGIPYGFPFAEALKEKVCEGMAERIEEELHKAGIWLVSDISKKPGAAQGAVLAAYGVDLAILIQLAKQYQGGK